MAFEDKFKQLRLSKNISQKDLASIFNVAQTTISKWEKGERTPNYEMLQKIAEYFQVNPNYFLTKDEYNSGSFNLQMFGNVHNVQEIQIATEVGHILTLKDEKTKKLTLQIIEGVLHLSVPQLEALSALIKTIK